MVSLVISISKCIEDKLFYPYTEERYFLGLRRKQKKTKLNINSDSAMKDLQNDTKIYNILIYIITFVLFA